jgi:hypothetical protein
MAFFLLKRSIAASSLGTRDKKGMSLVFPLLLSSWFLSVYYLARVGFFNAVPGPIPRIAYWLAVPLLLFAGLLRWNRKFETLISNAPLSLAALAQTVRVGGLVFLFLAARHQLPWLFAIPAAAGDFLVGITAPWVAFALGRGKQEDRGWLRFWNWAGLADFALAVGIGLFAAPVPFRVFHTDPSTQMLGSFPMALIPAFVVPLCAMLHWISLRNLSAQSPERLNRRVNRVTRS